MSEPVAVVDAPVAPRRPSRLEAVTAALQTPKARRAIDLAAPIGVVVLAAALRLTNLGAPHALVFDETYYVKDSYSIWHQGFEGVWPDDANTSFLQGDATVTDEPAFVVHPPLGKWILGIGMAIGGIDDAVAWRLPAAIVGMLVVILTIAIGRGIMRSWTWGALAGLFVAIDGLAIVMSRTVLLDQTLTLFVLLGVGALLLDRRGAPRRMARWRARHPDAWIGPALWRRPWIVAAGVALGLACGVKWSGLYFVAALGLWSVAMEVLDRRRARLDGWIAGTLVVQAPVSAVLLLVPAIGAYLATWIGWFGRGWGNDWAATHPSEASTGILGLLPDGLASLVQYHREMWGFHVGLTKDHAFESPAWQWMPMLRPTAFYLENHDGLMAFITALANPMLWYSAVVAALVLLYRVGSRGDRTALLLVTCVVAGYVPWLAFPERTIFSFYSVVFLPFLYLGLAYVFWRFVRGRGSADTRLAGGWLLATLVVLAIAATVFFAPIWYGVWEPEWATRLRFWLPGWR